MSAVASAVVNLNDCLQLFCEPEILAPDQTWSACQYFFLLGVIRKGRLHGGGGVYGPVWTKADKGETGF